MQYVIYTHNYGCWSSIEDLPGNLEKPIIWSDILMYPGDFHCMLMFFSVIGSYPKGRGFRKSFFKLRYVHQDVSKTL